MDQLNQMNIMNQVKKNRICLFTRVSTEKQDYERQILELNEFCTRLGYDVVKVISTKISGARTARNRPDLVELLASAKRKQFDKVLVTEISRIGRDAKDIRSTIDQLHTYNIGVIFKNLGLESLDENGQETFVTNIIISIFAEFSQEEKRILIDRIKSGLRSAKVKGKQLGRPKGACQSSQIIKKYSTLTKDLKLGVSLRHAMKIHGLSKGTIIKVKRLL